MAVLFSSTHELLTRGWPIHTAPILNSLSIHSYGIFLKRLFKPTTTQRRCIQLLVN